MTEMAAPMDLLLKETKLSLDHLLDRIALTSKVASLSEFQVIAEGKAGKKLHATGEPIYAQHIIDPIKTLIQTPSQGA